MSYDSQRLSFGNVYGSFAELEPPGVAYFLVGAARKAWSTNEKDSGNVDLVEKSKA